MIKFKKVFVIAKCIHELENPHEIVKANKPSLFKREIQFQTYIQFQIL